MDPKWPYTFWNRWTSPEKRTSINVNVSRATEVPSIKRKKKCFETLWIIYLRKEIKVKDKRTTHSPQWLAKSYLIFSSLQILFWQTHQNLELHYDQHFCLSFAPQLEFQNRKKTFKYEFLKVCVINKTCHIPSTLLSEKEWGRTYRI